MTRRWPAVETIRAEQGFSLPEVIVSALLVLLMLSAAVSLVAPHVRLVQSDPAMTDLQQRARVSIDDVVLDLRRAGSGLESGDDLGGSLIGFFAPIVPRRVGSLRPDGPDTARSDTISLLAIESGWRHARLSQPLGSDGRLSLAAEPQCAAADPPCGLKPDTTLVVFDLSGRFSLFTLTAVDAAGGWVEPLGAMPGEPYVAGSAVAEVSLHTYYGDEAARQLRHYDGRSTDVAFVDNVVDVSFEYFGDPQPPLRPQPPAGTANCLYDSTGMRVGGGAVLSSGSATLVHLPLHMFTDGPWCGEGQNRFDADLLRVRQVSVAIRLQAVPDVFRAQGPAYRHAGFAHDAYRSLPDYGIRIAVAPRALNATR